MNHFGGSTFKTRPHRESGEFRDSRAIHISSKSRTELNPPATSMPQPAGWLQHAPAASTPGQVENLPPRCRARVVPNTTGTQLYSAGTSKEPCMPVRFSIVAAIVAALLGTASFAAEWHVSPRGNDAWSGSLAEPAAGRTDRRPEEGVASICSGFGLCRSCRIFRGVTAASPTIVPLWYHSRKPWAARRISAASLRTKYAQALVNSSKHPGDPTTRGRHRQRRDRRGRHPSSPR